jgi:hypothetical protein
MGLRRKKTAHLLAIALLCGVAARFSKAEASSPTIGMEAAAKAVLPAGLEAVPIQPRTRVILHIAGTKAVAGGTEYDLRYMVMEPGKYDLRAYLQDGDGRVVAEGPPVMVEGVSLLPAKNNAILLKVPTTPMPQFGGYTVLATTAVAVWALVLISLLLVGRKRRPRPLPVELPATPLTLAERLRPLVTAAARGELSVHQKSELEMLLLGYWRRRLRLEDLTMEEVMSRLRQDHGSGGLVQTLESWLHAPATAQRDVDIGRALAPYENAVDDAAEEESTAV